MDDLQVCSNWEDIADNTSILDKQLEKLRLEKSNGEQKIKILARKNPNSDEENQISPSSSTITIDSSREESLRSQYVPPEPKIKLLARPKANESRTSSSASSKSKSTVVKTLEQREKEYMEARMRILGDVQFSDPEDVEGEISPAELLKQKVAEAAGTGQPPTQNGETEAEKGPESEEVNAESSQIKSKSKKKRDKFKTPHIESPRDFPLGKTESDRIVRQPRGPDGTSGFANTNR